MALDYLQQVIQDIHSLMARDTNPKYMPVYAGCLRELTKVQAEKMSDPQAMAGQDQPTQDTGQADPAVGALLAQLGG